MALNQVINAMGYDAQNIDYNDTSRVWRSLSSAQKLRHLLWKAVQNSLLGGRERSRRFDAFRREHLRLSERAWTSPQQLSDDPPLYDLYLSGSDQIWNPDVIHGDYSYLLAFVPKAAGGGGAGKKLAYASSFGKAALPEGEREPYRRYLSEYSAIGVRESSGRAILKELLDIEAQVVLDPTLLLDRRQWSPLAARPGQGRREKYILCYHMPGDGLVTGAIHTLADRLSAATGLHVIHLGLKEYCKWKRGLDCRTDYGPAEFLSAFLDAEAVITNSFHGTAFAANFGKRLIVPVNMELDQETARHRRMVDFLELLDAGEAMLPVYKGGIPDGSPVCFGMDMALAADRLAAEREKSLVFLKGALEGCENG